MSDFRHVRLRTLLWRFDDFAQDWTGPIDVEAGTLVLGRLRDRALGLTVMSTLVPSATVALWSRYGDPEGNHFTGNQPLGVLMMFGGAVSVFLVVLGPRALADLVRWQRRVRGLRRTGWHRGVATHIPTGAVR